MSLPSEKARALINTRNYLRRMLSPYNGGIKRIPTEVRREIRGLLKHWPSTYELHQALKKNNKFICHETFKKELINEGCRNRELLGLGLKKVYSEKYKGKLKK